MDGKQRCAWRPGVRSSLRLAGAVLALAFLPACDSGSEPPDEVEAPRANVGANRNVPLGEVVTLNGGGSSDPQFLYLSYAWAFLSRPPGSNAVLEHATEPIATFVPDVDGLYQVTLTVDNGHLSDTDTVRIATAPDVAEVINLDIEQNTHLRDLYANPYAVDYIISQPIDVTARVTIEEGVRIETRGGIWITIAEGGSLQATGTADEPVVIEGMKERQGYWRGIEILPGSGENFLTHVELSNGGGPVPNENNPDVESYDGMLVVRDGGAISVTNSLFRDSYTWGVFVEPAGDFEESGNTYQNNRQGNVSQ